MPGYRLPCVRSTLKNEQNYANVALSWPNTIPVGFGSIPVDPEIAPILTSILIHNLGGHYLNLQIVPIISGFLTPAEYIPHKHVPLYNHDTTVMASEAI